jgi:hypothetical protein
VKILLLTFAILLLALLYAIHYEKFDTFYTDALEAHCEATTDRSNERSYAYNAALSVVEPPNKKRACDARSEFV